MKKTKRNPKFKRKGGFFGYAPVIDDLLVARKHRNSKHQSDIVENRLSLFEKTQALKELISWIELSLGNVGRAGVKSDVPIFTQMLNRGLLNRLDKNWTSKNLVTQKQLDDYFNEIGEGNPEFIYLGYDLLRYLKQLHILITGTSGPFRFKNSRRLYSIHSIQLEPSTKLPVSEQYRTYLQKKLGADYLQSFQTNYDMVTKFFNDRLKPLIPEEVNDASVYDASLYIDDFPEAVSTSIGPQSAKIITSSDDSADNQTLVEATRLRGGARKKTHKKRQTLL